MTISIEFHENDNKIMLRTDEFYNVIEYEVDSMKDIQEAVCEYISEVIKV